MFGFLNIYKPKGKTSHDIVAILRRITRIKQIGHTGTLDPFAEGVLPICIGKATRLIEYLDDDKAYIGTIKFGNSTTTYDLEGNIVNSSDLKVSLTTIETELDNFRGEILQYPPIYSAIKVKGKKLYEYARNNEDIKIEPRKVFINKLEIVGFNEPEQTLELYIECSKGTYIRSIAHDLGKKLGCYGHLSKLVRTRAGLFKLDDAIKLEDLTEAEQVKSLLIPPMRYLTFPRYELNDMEKEKVSHGNPIKINSNDGLILLTQNNELISVAEANNGIAKSLKVFI